jgi:hypothetical protein
VRESEAARENVTFLKRCWTCDELYRGSGRTCSRDCLMILASFEDFTTLQSVLINARWAGAPSQAELQREYYREQLRAAVRWLPHRLTPESGPRSAGAARFRLPQASSIRK